MRFASLTIMLAALAGSVSGAAALDLKSISYTTPGAGKVVFSHKEHLNLKSEKTAKFSCKTCHATRPGGKDHFSMADLEKGKSCGKCHDGRTAFSTARCTGCHKVKEITYQVKQTGAVHFSHARHLKETRCDACHSKLFAAGPNRTFTMAEMEKGKSCGACHDGTKAFSIGKCASCHPTREIVFNVKQAGPTRFSHIKHLELYPCSACHAKLYSLGHNKHVSMAAMEKGKSCGACHNGNEAFAVAECAKCHPVRDITFKLANAASVKFSHTSHLGLFKCGSCHTGTFPLNTGNRPVTMGEMKKARSCGVCHDGTAAFTVRGNCDTCHVRG